MCTSIPERTINEEEVDLLEHVNPYRSQTDQFVSSLEQFRQRSGDTLDFTDEQAILTAVHGPRDRQIIDQLRTTASEHRRRMFAVMRGEDNADARHLIRDVFQQQVTIHANPDELLDSPFDAPSFGLHPGTLQGYIKSWLERYEADDRIPWAVKWLWQPPRDEFADQENRSRYEWKPVDTPETALGAPLIVVHPALATYHPKLGLNR